MTQFPKPWNKNQQFVLVTKCCKDAQLVKMLVICAMTMSADQLNQHLPVCARLSAVSTNILIQLCWLCNQKLPNMAKFWSFCPTSIYLEILVSLQSLKSSGSIGWCKMMCNQLKPCLKFWLWIFFQVGAMQRRPIWWCWTAALCTVPTRHHGLNNTCEVSGGNCCREGYPEANTKMELQALDICYGWINMDGKIRKHNCVGKAKLRGRKTEPLLAQQRVMQHTQPSQRSHV